MTSSTAPRSDVRTITPALAHVSCEENLLVRKVWEGEEPNTYVGVFSIDGTHPYLYENPAIANHVSGTTFIDMGRQFLKAVAHLYMNVPMENRFVLHGVNIDFLRWAKLGVDIEVSVVAEIEPGKSPEDRRTCRTSFVWKQEGHLIAKATSSFTTFSKALEDKLMSRQYKQPPADQPAPACEMKAS